MSPRMRSRGLVALFLRLSTAGSFLDLQVQFLGSTIAT